MRPASPPRRDIALNQLIPLVLSALVVLAVLPVIAIGYAVSTDTTQRLLGERAELIVDGLENQIRNQLDPVADQLAYARVSLLEGVIDPRDDRALHDFALGLLAGTPQVAGIGILRDDLSMRRWQRATLEEFIEPLDRQPAARAALEAAKEGRVAYWAAPLVSPALKETILNHRVALEVDGELFGVLAAVVTSRALSHYVAEISQQFGATAFILLGRDRVIAYPNRPLAEMRADMSDLPRLAEALDPVMARMWDDPRPADQTDALKRTDGHWTSIDNIPYAYFYREISGYGPEPLTIGVAMPSSDTRRERWSSAVAAGLGLTLMAIAAILAWHLGRRMTRPTAEINNALNAISKLEFDRVSLPRLANSRVSEWRRMARSLTDTATALSAFQTYLPRALVRRIFNVSRGGVRSRERQVTLMFADLEGFTAYSRGRDAIEVAAHLNALFGLIGPIVEASGGVIDKYTGDGLLAFWGAPDPQPDHAARACRAAAEIALAVETRAREHDGPMPRLRIGLHTGPVVAGNIGFPGRIDYTLVGDTVNTAERTEKALRGVAPQKPAVIAVTEDVLDAGGNRDGVLAEGPLLPQAPRPTYLCTPIATDRR